MRRVSLAALAVVAVAAAAYGLIEHFPYSRNESKAGRRVIYYVDPMHPAYKSDKPGVAPDCGMQLVAVYAGSTSSGAASNRPAGTVRIDADQQQLIGLRTAEVQKSAGNTSVRALGKVAVDDGRIYRLNG